MEKELNRLKEMLEEEISKIAKKGDITPAELDNATKAVCLIEKIRELEGYSEEYGYSERMYNGMHDPEMIYGEYGNGSYARGRSPVTGRYISRGMDHMDRRVSRGGYSGHSINDRMIAKLEEMYDEAKTEHERDTVDMWIKRLETER